MKSRVYISGKISGIESEAELIFKKAEKHLLKLGYDVVNPMTIEHNHDLTWVNYMKSDIKAMMNCNAVYLLPNYKDSKGALIEKQLAMDLNMTIIYGKIL